MNAAWYDDQEAQFWAECDGFFEAAHRSRSNIITGEKVMWIKAQNGRLVNLAHYSSVIVFGASIEAFPAGGGDGGGPVTLSKFQSKAEADEAMSDLYDWIREQGEQSRTTVGCDFSVSLDAEDARAAMGVM